MVSYLGYLPRIRRVTSLRGLKKAGETLGYPQLANLAENGGANRPLQDQPTQKGASERDLDPHNARCPSGCPMNRSQKGTEPLNITPMSFQVSLVLGGALSVWFHWCCLFCENWTPGKEAPWMTGSHGWLRFLGQIPTLMLTQFGWRHLRKVC